MIGQWIKKTHKKVHSPILSSAICCFSFVLFFWQKPDVHVKFFLAFTVSNDFDTWQFFEFEMSVAFQLSQKKRTKYLKIYLALSNKISQNYLWRCVWLPFKWERNILIRKVKNIDECKQIVQYHLENIESFLILSHVARPILEQRVPKLLSQKMMVKVCTQST